ncbi:hypothetical protein ACNOYE_09510 [Nannocystaceae bacterium ST9]
MNTKKALGFSSLPSTRNSSSSEIRLVPDVLVVLDEGLESAAGSCARAQRGSSIVDKTAATAKTEEARFPVIIIARPWFFVHCTPGLVGT